MAIKRFRGREESDLCLLNAEIIESSDETDVKYECCLSLFDVRGQIERPLEIKVRAQNFDGSFWEKTFTNGDARLICHEIDHFDGHLYVDNLVGELITADEIRATPDAAWIYK